LGLGLGFLLATARCGGDSSGPSRPDFEITAEKGQPIQDGVLLPWMEYFGIPGLSLAVVENDAIDWAKGYGTLDRETDRPVTQQSPFQAASISKTVAAATALLVFRSLGLDLDADVGKHLRSWRIPEHPFTGGSPVTLRLLLSHSAGFNVHGFAGYRDTQPLPTLLQILNGAAPANNEPIRVISEPGATFRYAGGGFQVVRQLLEDVSGAEPYAQLAQRHVLDRAGMAQSSFLHPLQPDNTASGHAADGKVLGGKWHRYPELTSTGLWTTPADLARLMIELQRSYRGERNTLLPVELAREMFTGQRLTGPPDHYVGLGVFLHGTGPAYYFEHGGSNYGYRGVLLGFLNARFGMVLMSNSEAGADGLFPMLIEAILAAYSYPRLSRSGLP
jgi:CubicO group peptidase (beta-lactamase class C family)